MSPSPSPAFLNPALEAVLHKLAAHGQVTQRMRRSAEMALGVVPPSEEIILAYPCGVLSAGAGQDGVAVLTPQRLSVFERRGFRSPDQKLHLVVSRPISIETGPGATRLTLAAAGGRPTTIDLFEANRAETLRDELAALRSAREAGWWTDHTVAWPGGLGAETWSYLGGDPRFLHPALELRLQVDPLGFTLVDSDGSTAHLAPWSSVSHVHVISPAQGFERAAERGFLVSGGFASAWRSAEWSAFLVVGYTTGEQVFLGTTELSESELRNRLYPVAAAMPAEGARPATPEPPAGPEPAVAESPVAETPVVAERAFAGTRVPDEPPVAAAGGEPEVTRAADPVVAPEPPVAFEPVVTRAAEPVVAPPPPVAFEPVVTRAVEPVVAPPPPVVFEPPPPVVEVRAAAPAVFDWEVEVEPAPAGPATTAPYSLVEALERLGVLYREGVIDGDEFVRAKAAVLRG